MWGSHDECTEENGIGEILGGHFHNHEGEGLVPGIASPGCDEGEGKGGGEDVTEGYEEIQELGVC